MSFWSRLGGGKSKSEQKRLDYLSEALALERQGDYDAALETSGGALSLAGDGSVAAGASAYRVRDGRLTKRHGFWQWIGDPIMPCGLVELIESRIGALPAAVGAVIDALAIGEPIKLPAALKDTGFAFH